jgi:hypothetical protein
MILRALELPEKAHTLLTGSPACAKSLFMRLIEDLKEYNKIYDFKKKL